MKSFIFSVLVVISMAFSPAATAQVINLTPASPQPSNVKKGLSVNYFFGDRSVRNLAQAKSKLKWAKPGTALPGLNFPDKGKGAPVMTSGKPELVVADINGYIKFPKSGVYDLEFFTNDGAQIWISGKSVGKLNMITPCASAGRPKVNVPQAGWYDIKVLYWQKEGTACFESEWKAPGGSVQLIPDSAFGH